MSDVDVPAVGRVNRQWVFVGVAAVAGIAGVMWLRHRNAAAAAAPVADPATGTNSTDPNYTNPDPVYTDTGNNAQTPPATDQDWVNLVMNKMNWMEPSYLAQVLGKYLARQPLTSDEADVVRQAWAQEGKPPSNTQIILATGGSTPGGPPKPPPPPTPTPTPTPKPPPPPTPAPKPTPPPPPAPKPPPPPPQKRTHTVVSGESLWSISQKMYGTPNKYMDIYWANEGVIVSTARSHGHYSNYADWIFPGEVLVIP